MSEAELKVKLFGTRGSAEAYAIRDFLHRCDVPFEWIELSDDAKARSEAHVDGLNDRRLPICFFPDGTRMEHPTVRQISEKLGLFQNPSRSEYDLSIYGAGPAGLSAAVYGASEGLKTVLIERFAVGGQAGSSPKIENYLGFPGGISGADLALRAREQACRFGAEILLLREGVRGEFLPGKGIGYLSDGTKIVARACICATGGRVPPVEPAQREQVSRGGRLLWSWRERGNAVQRQRSCVHCRRRQLGRAGCDAFCPLHHKGHDRGSRQLTEEKRLAISG